VKTVLALLGLALATRDGAASTGEERAVAAGASLIGQSAPALVLKTIDGATVDLGALYGKRAVYLKFWATWCVPCREQMPHFERTYERAGPALAVIAVNAGFNDDASTVRAFVRAYGLKMPIVIDDGRLAQALNLQVTPQHVIIGTDGRILYVGHLADERLEAALREATRPARGLARMPVPAAPAPTARLTELPAAELTTLAGARFALRDGSHSTVLVFLSPWCESYLADSRPTISANCRRARELSEALARGSGARWLGIASGLWASPEELAEYQAHYGVHLALSLDASGDWFRSFAVREVPVIVLADRTGRIVRRFAGEELKDDALARALTAL
jgi:thiol-disulfide isomerase/thioredoxin